MDVLLDTHAWIWSLTDDPRFSDAAHAAAAGAAAVRLSPISLYEIAQKVRVGKWPEMAAYVPQLPDLARQQGLTPAAFDMEVARFAGSFDWPHRDPFDRIIAATAMHHGCTLLSADTMFDTLADPRMHRIW